MKVIVSTLVMLASSCIAFSQFSAEMTNVVQGNKREYKVYSDLDRYRYEFEDSGMKGVVIVHPEENKTLTLNLSEGQLLLLKGYEGELETTFIKE